MRNLGNTRITYTPTAYSQEVGLQVRINEAVDYFPYGKVLREYRDGQEERYLTTQHERDVESGLDYRGARYYDSEVSRFLSIDPLASKFPAWSTYNYVMGNPLAFTAPTGRSPQDNIKISKNGDIDIVPTKDEFDMLIIEDNSETLKLNKGEFQYKWNDKNGGDILQFKGHDSGQKDFEFLARNTNVEWGLLKTQRGSSKNSFVTTSHLTDKEYASNNLIQKKLSVENYSISKKSHSHPSNNAAPSGSWSIEAYNFEPAKPRGTWGDNDGARWAKENMGNNNGQTITFKIYLTGTNKYINYDENSILQDYR